MPPPDHEQLQIDMLENDRDRYFEVMLSGIGGNPALPYLPWDKLRHRKPPQGFSHEEWWLATQSTRNSMRRMIPMLRTKEGHAFTYSLPDSVLKASEAIAQQASGRLAATGEVVNPSTRDRYIISSLIEEAITSSQLEGAVTTRRVAKEMLRTGRPPANHSETMIINNYAAMHRIRELRNEKMTPELVQEIHRIVTDGTLEDESAAGRLQRPDDIRVGIYDNTNGVDTLLHQPPDAVELPSRLDALCAFANADQDEDFWIQPVLRALTIHFMMGYDHYFEDGNGRTARALFYWSMLREGYWLAEFLSISRILKQAPSKYAASYLHVEQDSGDLTYFYDFHLGVILRAIDDLNSYLNRKLSEVSEMQLALSATPGQFNHRQMALLHHVLKIPDAVITVESHARSHNIANETARRDLNALESRRLLHREKISKRNVWMAAKDFGQSMTSANL